MPVGLLHVALPSVHEQQLRRQVLWRLRVRCLPQLQLLWEPGQAGNSCRNAEGAKVCMQVRWQVFWRLLHLSHLQLQFERVRSYFEGQEQGEGRLCTQLCQWNWRCHCLWTA